MRLRKHKHEFIVTALFLMAVLVGPLLSPYFADARFLLESSTLYTELGLLALGLTLVIATGNIDLSPASNLALCGCICAKLCAAHWGAPAAAIASMAVGGAMGFFNGALVAYARMPSVLVTLATLALYRGIAQALMGANSVAIPESLAGMDRIFLGKTAVPAELMLFLLSALGLSVMLRKTVFGRRILAVGSNARASELSAVPVQHVTIGVFTFLGVLAGLGGVLIISRLGVARFDHARGLELGAITAVVLGGTSIAGGRGSVFGTVMSVFLMAAVQTGMGLANVKVEIQMMVIGFVLIAALTFSGTKSTLKALIPSAGTALQKGD